MTGFVSNDIRQQIAYSTSQGVLKVPACHFGAVYTMPVRLHLPLIK